MVIQGFKDRTVSIGEKVRVYRNLNNGKWSVRAMTGEYKGKVVAHLDSLTLTDIVFVISVAGRARVLREGRKNVHAFAMGILSSDEAIPLNSNSNVITYDPYRSGFFYSVSSADEALTDMGKLCFSEGKAYI